MNELFVGEIRMFGGDFAPSGWALCEGQLLPIAGNDTLFGLIGTTYGGDGKDTFALPDLRARAPIHQGKGAGCGERRIGEAAGSREVTLTTDQIAGHGHVLRASTDKGSQPDSAGNVLATSPVEPYASAQPDATLAAGAVQPIGGDQPHDNRQPYLAINFIIALTGVAPSRS